METKDLFPGQKAFHLLSALHDDLFWHDFFQHCLDMFYAQVYLDQEHYNRHQLTSVRVFLVAGPENPFYEGEPLALVLAYICESVVPFRMGSRDAWENYRRRFAAQFRGDNS